MKKIFLSLIILALAYCNVLADYTVSNVKVVQKFSPWGRVDISFEVNGSAPSNIDSSKLWFVVVAEDKTTGKNYESTTNALSGDVKFSTGTHYVVWDMAKDGVRIDKSKTVFTVEIRFEAIYAIVDLSGSTSATKYPITYWNKMPSSGWSDEYKTTKLVLRKITAGKMPRTDVDITLTKDYYVGVFEVTQRQWELVMGNNPSYFDGDTLPVEMVSYDDIRGTSNGSQWPASNAVDATSFVGKLRAKTGIDFDLPTEAQWEYACRAGSSGTSGLLADGTMGKLEEMGWYVFNSSSKTHTVGTKTPNAWGLYDMLGNVYEWCLDWYSSSGYSGTDPVGATSGYSRIYRGGCWCHSAANSTTIYHYFESPDFNIDWIGFRLAAPASARIDIGKTYVVTFNANGGEGTMSSQTFMHGVEQALSANAFTREGYTFAGWATSADGAVVYTAGESISVTEPMTLYAVWQHYIVVDLSGGESAASYPVTTLSEVPAGGWTDEYKTTKLVLRKITAGKMPRTDVDITLTKDYYVGLFEVTQKQWELVMGSYPSYFDGDTLPVEQVSYDDIRGTSNGSQWPASNAVDASSFMGKLRAKTGIDFDLPTEAQWEYACRAGSSGDWGLLADGTMGTLDAMGWYSSNSGDKTHTVGTKTPNAWGLYDMHGNVWELCLDRYSSSGYSGTDPVGATSGYYRVDRGGSWFNGAYNCTATCRYYDYPNDLDRYNGFRLAAPAGL